MVGRPLGCGFEDFLGYRYGDGNIVALYLKRRGWKETALNRCYFAALRDTPVSLFEVTCKQWDNMRSLAFLKRGQTALWKHSIKGFDP